MSQPLHSLLLKSGLEVPPTLGDNAVTGVSCDSRRVGPGTLFVGVPGGQVDGGLFWPKALSSGAVAAVIGAAAAAQCPPSATDAVLVVQEPLAEVAGRLAAAFWGSPASSWP